MSADTSTIAGGSEKDTDRHSSHAAALVAPQEIAGPRNHSAQTESPSESTGAEASPRQATVNQSQNGGEGVALAPSPRGGAAASPTPRPWEAARFTDEHGEPFRGASAAEYAAQCVRAGHPDAGFYGVWIPSADDGHPADVCHTGNGPRSKANAELIVRAVNAHDELTTYLRLAYIELHKIQQHFGDVWDCEAAGCSKRREVLAKAEARQ